MTDPRSFLSLLLRRRSPPIHARHKTSATTKPPVDNGRADSLPSIDSLLLLLSSPSCARARDGAPVREPPTPPSRKTVRQFAQQAPHVSFWRKLYESGEYKRWLLYAVEAYGIFKIGEMVGRRHIVGYKLDESRTHALT